MVESHSLFPYSSGIVSEKRIVHLKKGINLGKGLYTVEISST